MTITGISPDWGYGDETTAVSVTGEGFVEGLTIRVGPEKMGILEVVGDSLVDAMIPEGLEPGTYDVIVALPDESTASLTDAFEVREREVTTTAASDGGGCGGAGRGGLGLLWSLGLLMALTWRQRRGASSS